LFFKYETILCVLCGLKKSLNLGLINGARTGGQPLPGPGGEVLRGGKEEKFIDEGWGIAYDFSQFCPASLKKEEKAVAKKKMTPGLFDSF